MNKDMPCPGFSKIVKTLSGDIFIACGRIDEKLSFYPFEVRDVSRDISQIKAAAQDLRKYAVMLEQDNTKIRSTLRPVEWEFAPYFSEKSAQMHTAADRLAEQLRENQSSLTALDIVSLSLDELKRGASILAGIADSLRVETGKEEAGCEQTKAKQRTNAGSEDYRSQRNRQ